jgi:hypothetical protein
MAPSIVVGADVAPDHAGTSSPSLTVGHEAVYSR